MNTCEGEELSKDNVGKRKNKYDVAINKLKLKFRRPFLSERGGPEKCLRCNGGKKMLL